MLQSRGTREATVFALHAAANIQVLDGLRQGPDVVVGQPQGLDLRHLRVVRKAGQHLSKGVEGRVEVVHPVPLPVVGLQPPVPLQPHDQRRTTTASSRLAVSPRLVAGLLLVAGSRGGATVQAGVVGGVDGVSSVVAAVKKVWGSGAVAESRPFAVLHGVSFRTRGERVTHN